MRVFTTISQKYAHARRLTLPPQELPEFSSEAVKHMEDERFLSVVVSWMDGGECQMGFMTF